LPRKSSAPTRKASIWRAGLLYHELTAADASVGRAASLVSHEISGDDLAARVGEHGLAVLLRRDEPGRLAADAEAIARAVAAGLGETSLGAGLCPLDQGGSEALTLVSRARKAACLHLKSGGHGIATYGYGPPGLVADRREVILGAVESSAFELLFQPVVSVRGEARARYEATLRLRTGDGELLGPEAFAPVAIRAKVTSRLDRWVLESSLDALAAARAAGSHAQLLVHQTLAGLNEDDWLERLRDGISRRDLIDLRPVIQLQAADADRCLELASEHSRVLRTLGIELCLNGLGEGGGRGVRLLEALHVRFVRLSARVTTALSTQRLKDLVRWLHEHGVVVIAGGLEGPDAIARVMGAGVDCIQGPFIQAPAETMDFDFSCAESPG
jgi:EAL domain-containing protein (putative c-di-GMP-specific phosphodiesterase class I)